MIVPSRDRVLSCPTAVPASYSVPVDVTGPLAYSSRENVVANEHWTGEVSRRTPSSKALGKRRAEREPAFDAPHQQKRQRRQPNQGPHVEAGACCPYIHRNAVY